MMSKFILKRQKSINKTEKRVKTKRNESKITNIEGLILIETVLTLSDGELHLERAFDGVTLNSG